MLEPPPQPVSGRQPQHKLLSRVYRPDLTRGGLLPDALWPPGPHGWPEIPFYMQTDLEADVRETWEHGRTHWETHTCITFREVEQPDREWLNCSRPTRQPVVCVQGAPSGCFSAVGRQHLASSSRPGWLRPQVLNLDPEMCKQTSVIHEIGHTVGLVHEMARTAARGALAINYRHMRLSRHLWAQTQLCPLDEPRVPYDYLSIMHYGTFAGSRDGQAVFVTRDPRYQHLVDHNDDVRFVPGLPTLSHLDRYVINTEYGCEQLWAQRRCGGRRAECLNQGYMGANCSCLCPPSHAGTRCQTRVGPMFPPPRCWRQIRQAAELQLGAAGLRLRHQQRPESCTLLLRGAALTQARVTIHAEEYVRLALQGVDLDRMSADACSLGLSALALSNSSGDGRNECVDAFLEQPALQLRLPHPNATIYIRLHQVTARLERSLRRVRVSVEFERDAGAVLRVRPVNRAAQIVAVLKSYRRRLTELASSERNNTGSTAGACTNRQSPLAVVVIFLTLALANCTR